MELDRSARLVELAMCVVWFTAFFLRIRSIQAPAGEWGFPGIHGALRPVRIAAWVVLALTIPLWVKGPWQPFAHAISIPTLLAGGIAIAIVSAGKRAAAQTPVPRPLA